MLRLLYFFEKNKTGIVFVLLELIALFFVIRTHSYHYSKYLDSANAISGTILEKSHAVTSYFHLKKENKDLMEENTMLRNQIQKRKPGNETQAILQDSLQKFVFSNAQVISNPYHLRNNILTINKGSDDGIKPDMGVITHKGVVGITLNVSRHFATVLSILHSQAKINVKIKNKAFFGSLVWNGKDYRKAAIVDLPIQANVQVGDTIVTGGKSLFFPKGIPIGTIGNFKRNDKAYTDVVVDLSIDFSALENVYIIHNTLYAEQKQLENLSTTDE